MKHKKKNCTYSIRRRIVKDLEEYCHNAVRDKSSFVDIAIEEKLNRETKTDKEVTDEFYGRRTSGYPSF